MDNKIKMLFGVLTVVAMLGCITPTGDTGVGATNIVLSVEDPNVGKGYSAAITALITNGWDNDLTGGAIYWKPIRTDLTYPDPNPDTNIGVIANSEYVTYKNAKAETTAFAGSYSVYATYCFSYLTDGYRRVVVSAGTSDTSPASAYTSGPVSITYGGIPKINTNVQSKTSLQFTFEKVLAGEFWNGTASVLGMKDRMESIKLSFDGDKLNASSYPTGFTVGGSGVSSYLEVTDPMIISDRYSAAVEFTWQGGTVTTEQELTIGVEANYVFCIDSNTVNINVVG